MRKVLVSLLVLALCAPAMADVTISGADNGDGTATITMVVDGASVVRGVALNVACTDNSLVDLTYGATDAGLNTFIDYLYANGVGGVAGDTPAQEGHPYADATGPGEAVAGATEFAICAGALDAAGAQAGLGAGTYVVATVNVGAGEICITEDGLRGGIVGDDLGTVTLVDVCPLPIGGGECYTGPQYADWVAVGKPDCWCASNNPRQCAGDADGLAQGKQNYWVSTNDLNILVGAWNKPVEQLTGDQICADFDHQAQGKQNYRVSTNDLNILVANWNQSNLPAPTCP